MRTAMSVVILTGLLSTASLALAQNAPPVPVVEATATAPTQQGGANRAVIVAGDTPFIIGTAELAGLEIYDLSGKRIGSADAGEAVGVDIRYGVSKEPVRRRPHCCRGCAVGCFAFL
jgi:3-phytase